MVDTLIIQSHRSPLPYAWIADCLQSVRDWCGLYGYDYRFIENTLFAGVPRVLFEKTSRQPVIASDLARLLRLRDALKEGYATVVWMDADFLIFRPEDLLLPASACAVGREVWVQPDSTGQLKVYKKVHNAFLMFKQGDSFLDFYIDTALRLLQQTRAPVPPQFIGPKLLTALHNVVNLPVLETAAMLSPRVIEALLAGGGPALEIFRHKSPQPPAGANLCISSCEKGEINPQSMQALIDSLLTKQVKEEQMKTEVQGA